jgi:hypothetical protein
MNLIKSILYSLFVFRSKKYQNVEAQAIATKKSITKYETEKKLGGMRHGASKVIVIKVRRGKCDRYREYEISEAIRHAFV